jgi:putative FmdB family regulatory protein
MEAPHATAVVKPLRLRFPPNWRRAEALNLAERMKMPIFTYRCRACGERFSTLVNSGETPVCKACESEDLERQLSLIAAPAKGGDPAPAVAACGAPMEACCGGGSCAEFADA